MAQSSSSMIERVRRRLADEQYYDGYQLCCSFVNRLCNQRKGAEATALCAEVSDLLAAARQFELAACIGTLLVTEVFERLNLPPTTERINLVLHIFSAEPGGVFVEERYKFMDKALHWAGGDRVELRRIAGLAALRDEQFGRSQAHLVHCRDSDGLPLLLQRWGATVYPSERDLLFLRAVLILLARGDITVALELFLPHNLQPLGINLDDQEVPPPAAVQLAYFATQACALRQEAFFSLVSGKYHLVVRRDPSFAKLVQIIEKRIFGRQPTSGWENSVLQLLGGLAGPVS